MVKKSQVTWTKDEENILLESGSDMTKDELHALIPRHTPTGIRIKAERLGIVVSPELRSRYGALARSKVNEDNLYKMDQSLTWYDIDPTVRQIILGSILGDASIKKNTNSRRFLFYEAHTKAQIDYLLWKAKMMHQFYPKTWFTKRKERFGVNNDLMEMCTVSHSMFTKLRDDFYPARTHSKKTLIPDIASNLSILGLLIWYLDDGCAHLSGSTYAQPSISAKRFDYDQLSVFIATLNKNLGLEMWVTKNKHKGGWNKLVKLGAAGRDLLFPLWLKISNDLGIPECMLYKISAYRS